MVQCDAWSIKMMIRVFSSFVVLVVDRTFSHILIICGELLFCSTSNIQEISGPVSIYLGLKKMFISGKSRQFTGTANSGSKMPFRHP